MRVVSPRLCELWLCVKVLVLVVLRVLVWVLLLLLVGLVVVLVVVVVVSGRWLCIDWHAMRCLGGVVCTTCVVVVR